MINVDFDGSQAALDAIVTSIYKREIRLDATNIVDILDMADFLQVSLSSPLAEETS